MSFFVLEFSLVALLRQGKPAPALNRLAARQLVGDGLRQRGDCGRRS